MSNIEPEGQLTPAQHEIMQIVWDARRTGVTVGEIWNRVKESRDVARTTTLKQVERLEMRGWVERQEPSPKQKGNAIRYKATTGRRRARALMLQQFVNDYYDGSAVELGLSLLKFRCLSREDMQELCELLERRLS